MHTVDPLHVAGAALATVRVNFACAHPAGVAEGHACG
jgi:hypothetical protein